MRVLAVVVLAGVCLALGATAGYNFALFREERRLQRNKALVKRMHAEVWSEPDMEKVGKAIREIYTTDFVRHDWTGDNRLGIDGVVQEVRFSREAFPDMKEEIDNSGRAIVAERDFVVNLFHTTATQAREFGPIAHHLPRIPNRGKRLEMPEMEMFRVVNGKLAEQWLFNDIWGANIQLGLFDPDHWTESICGAQIASEPKLR